MDRIKESTPAAAAGVHVPHESQSELAQLGFAEFYAASAMVMSDPL